MVGDHLALDLLNTEAREGEARLEYWNCGEAVLEWLSRHGVEPQSGSSAVDLQLLLARAVALRALARDLITRRKRGDALDVSGLDVHLDGYLTSLKLLRSDAGELALARVPRGAPVPSLLGPVAEAVARLLVEADFNLVRQCEHPECILWFYDRTKAHQRRWCSMALCGNRHKAAQFRKRIGNTAGALPAGDGK